MTLTRLLETGRGELWWRLEIVGLPVIWTSRAEDVGAHGDGRSRVLGLRVPGPTLGERLVLDTGQLEGEQATVEILDIHQRATAEFAKVPEHRTWLTFSVTNTETMIEVLSTAGWPSSGHFFVGGETIRYTGTTGTAFTGCARAQWGTVATHHYVIDGLRPEVTSRPTTFEGRVAILHMRGSPMWRGVVRTEPAYSAGVWSLSIEHLASLLDQQVGADLAETAPVGVIYTSDTPLEIRLKRDTDPSWTEVTRLPKDAEYAFFASNDELIDEGVPGSINAQIAAATAGWAQNVRAVMRSDGRWTLRLVHPSGSPVTPVRASVLDANHGLDYAIPAMDAESQWCRDSFNGSPTTQDAPGTYYLIANDSGDTQRGLPPRGGSRGGGRRGILALSVEPAIGETLRLRRDGRTIRVSVAEILAPGIVRVEDVPGSSGIEAGYVWWGTEGRFALSVEREYTPVESGDVGDLLSEIIARGPAAAPLGHVPLLRSDDVVTSAFSSAVSGEPLARNRRFSWRERVSLWEIVGPELLLAGAVPTIDALGRLSAVALRVAAVSEAGVVTVRFVGSWPKYEGSAHGRWGSVEYAEGGAEESKRYVVRDVSALGRSPFARALSLEMQSRSVRPTTRTDIVAVSGRLLGLLGAPYRVVTGEVPISKWLAVTIGAPVRVTSDHVPGDGVMGVTDEAGIVIGRELQTDESKVLVAVLLFGDVLGYHVSALVSSQTKIGDNTWSITLNGDTADGTGPTAHLAVGDRVLVREWDAASPTEVAGTVDSITSATVVVVTFDETWTPGASTWHLRAVDAGASPAPSLAHRTRYVHVADASGRIPYPTPIAARKIAP